MRPTALLILPALLLASCRTAPQPQPRAATEQAMFGPSSVRLHRVFTRERDWTGGGTPDGIEALVELRDQFGDPTKAAGTLIFDLYEYRSPAPDPKGVEIAGPFVADLSTLDQQRLYWNRTSRTYSFQLAAPVKPDKSYVLTVSFQPLQGERLFDEMIVGRGGTDAGVAGAP